MGYYQKLNNCARIDKDENDDQVIDDNNENIHVMTKRILWRKWCFQERKVFDLCIKISTVTL